MSNTKSTIGRQTISVNTIVTLDVPIGAKSAEISIASGADGIRYSTGDFAEGLSATSGGTRLATGTIGEIVGLAELKAFRAVSTDGTPHILEIFYFG